MLTKKYKSELTKIQNPFEGIYTLEFRSLGGRFKYQPGQFLHLAIDGYYDGVGQWPESRCFSMRSNPDEQNIKISYAVKGAFTTQMKESIHVGSEVWLKLPYGDLFTQPHNKSNTVFIAGGTGITPFLSLFTHNSFKEYHCPHIYLGFRSIHQNIYVDELNSVKSCDIKIYYENVDGLLNINHIISEKSPDSDFFISGPPSMIRYFKQQLISIGVSQNKILTDDWE